jgi:CTP:molybdopterin cytidylyltransferase MocA
MYAGRIFDAEVLAGAGGSATSAAIRMDNAETMSIHTQVATTGGSVNVAYTYELSSSNDANAVWTTGDVPIATATALDVADFAPEASKFIRIIATNGDAAPVTLTAVLNMQES